jgi:uncharacterized membrane protein
MSEDRGRERQTWVLPAAIIAAALIIAVTLLVVMRPSAADKCAEWQNRYKAAVDSMLNDFSKSDEALEVSNARPDDCPFSDLDF